MSSASSTSEPKSSGEELQLDGSEPVIGAGIRRFKIVASVLILFHLSAVGLPPLAFQTSGESGPSPLMGILIRPFAGYSQFLHMNRGYAFFAPNPPVASSLIQAAIVSPNGTVTETMYPDRQQQWPRLLYHRHFMLTEFLNRVYFPPGPPDELYESDPEAAEDWKRRRGLYEYVRLSMVNHLENENEGREVAIRRIEHVVPALQSFQQQPIALTDERLYQVLLDQPIYSDDIAPTESTEEIPAPQVEADKPDRPETGDSREKETQAKQTTNGRANASETPPESDP